MAKPKTKKLYHTTALGRGNVILYEGWKVAYENYHVYGAGIYFWERYADAFKYGLERYGHENFEILSEQVPADRLEVIRPGFLLNLEAELTFFKQNNINLLVISNEEVQMNLLAEAKGDVYLWLLETNDFKAGIVK